MNGGYFRIDGADLETGEESYLVLQAATVSDAEIVARKQGLLVAAVRAASPADWGAGDGVKSLLPPSRIIAPVITFEPRLRRPSSRPAMEAVAANVEDAAGAPTSSALAVEAVGAIVENTPETPSASSAFEVETVAAILENTSKAPSSSLALAVEAVAAIAENAPETPPASLAPEVEAVAAIVENTSEAPPASSALAVEAAAAIVENAPETLRASSALAVETVAAIAENAPETPPPSSALAVEATAAIVGNPPETPPPSSVPAVEAVAAIAENTPETPPASLAPDVGAVADSSGVDRQSVEVEGTVLVGNRANGPAELVSPAEGEAPAGHSELVVDAPPPRWEQGQQPIATVSPASEMEPAVVDLRHLTAADVEFSILNNAPSARNSDSSNLDPPVLDPSVETAEIAKSTAPSLTLTSSLPIEESPSTEPISILKATNGGEPPWARSTTALGTGVGAFTTPPAVPVPSAAAEISNSGSGRGELAGSEAQPPSPVPPATLPPVASTAPVAHLQPRRGGGVFGGAVSKPVVSNVIRLGMPGGVTSALTPPVLDIGRFSMETAGNAARRPVPRASGPGDSRGRAVPPSTPATALAWQSQESRSVFADAPLSRLPATPTVESVNPVAEAKIPADSVVPVSASVGVVETSTAVIPPGPAPKKSASTRRPRSSEDAVEVSLSPAAAIAEANPGVVAESPTAPPVREAAVERSLASSIAEARPPTAAAQSAGPTATRRLVRLNRAASARRIPPPPKVEAEPIVSPPGDEASASQAPATLPEDEMLEAAFIGAEHAPVSTEAAPDVVSDGRKLKSVETMAESVAHAPPLEDRPFDLELESPVPSSPVEQTPEAPFDIRPISDLEPVPMADDASTAQNWGIPTAGEDAPVVQSSLPSSRPAANARQISACASPMALYFLAPLATVIMLGGIALILFTVLNHSPEAGTDLEKLDQRLQVVAQFFLGGAALIAGLLIFVIAALVNVARAVKGRTQG